MERRVNPIKLIACGGLAVGSCLVIYGAATSSELFIVSVIAAGVFFAASWGVGDVVSRAFRKRAAIPVRLFVTVCMVLVVGSLIYGALDTGFRYGSSTSAAWIISIGLILLSFSAAAMPLASTK